MSRRIEVELTSSRPDGVWTWRAAGARQPKGELDGSLLYPGAKVGDVVRADADFAVEGITVTSVLPPKGARTEPERIEIIGPPRRDEPGVTTVLAPKSKRGRREDRDDAGGRGPRRDGRPGRDSRDGRGGRPGDSRNERGPGGPRSDRPGDRGPRSGAGGPGGDRRARPPRPARPAPETKPKPKRLKAARTHRQALLNALPETHRPIADLLMRGGIPTVRQALDRQNALLKADGKPEIRPEPLLDIAERLSPSIRAAEWHDKADAALAAGDDIDIRDLRSVVVAADAAARDETTRALAAQLRDAVAARVDREHAAWLAEIAENLDGGRLVRALRLSSRPPKAGVPFPADLAQRLVTASAAGLTADITSDRFATLLDALAFSPVRLQVTAASVPAEPTPELLQAVKKAASRVPQIAAQFGIEAGAGAPKGPRPPKPRPPKPTAAAAPAAPAAPAATDRPAPPAPAPEASVDDAAPAPEAPTAEATPAPAVDPAAGDAGGEVPTAEAPSGD